MMDTNKTMIDKNDNEIDIREIVKVLWKRKLLIIAITLVFLILSASYSKFMISPVYQTKLNIVINMPDLYNTKFGEFTLPITTNQQYIDLINSNDVLADTIKDMKYDEENMSIDDLMDKIFINSSTNNLTAEGQEQNSFIITVKADEAQEAKLLAQTLYNNYIKFLDVMIIEEAEVYYEKMLSNEVETSELLLESTKNIIKRNEELLADTPKIIYQKDAMEEIQSGIDATNFIILEDIINPNYTDIGA
ncbi:MAG: Wzz/FepE/Etk N-terminal domain-containing protein, partial [Mobilitalea sp.]